MKRNLPIFLSILFLFIFGCGSGGSPRDKSGVLAVSLTDAPACGFDQVNVTISKVRVHQSANADGGEEDWGEIALSPPRKIDLLSLTNGILAPLGATSLAAGHYTQLRLILLPNTAEAPLQNSVVPTGGAEVPLEIPSALQEGIKLIHEFDLTKGGRVDLILDLDACRSVAQRGGAAPLLKPVISVIPREISGKIQGVLGSNLATGPALANVRITAQQEGKVVRSTSPDPSGNFILDPLVQSATAGTYDLLFTADNAATALIQSVPVSAQGTTTVSTSEEPIVLHPTAVRTVAGRVTPTTAAVQVLQHFAPGGPTVEVRSTNTVIDSGTYSLLLPADSPSLGLFGTGMLPISLTLRPDVAGRYTLVVSAEGSTTESRALTLGGSDLTGDFSLQP